MTFFVCRMLNAIAAKSGRAALAMAPVILAGLALGAFPAPASAELRQPPNSRIAIDIGDAFGPSDRFSGFIDAATQASFVMIELPAAAYEELRTLPDRKEALEQQGLGDAKKAELKGREGTFVYLVGTQSSPTGPFAKFVLIFLERGVTGMIIANIPQAVIDAGTYSRAQIEAILATATVMDTPAAAKEPFRFTYLGPFKLAFGMAGLAKVYSPSGAQPQPGENRLIKEPMLLVSSSVNNAVIDAKTEALRSFQRLRGMTDKSIDAEMPVIIAGLDGYQIKGKAADETAGAEIAVHLVMLSVAAGGYFLMVGTAPMQDKDKMMPEIEKVIASFEPVK